MAETAMFYSFSTRGFYDRSVHKVIPDDAVEISQELYRKLIDAHHHQAATIVMGPDGKPAVGPPSLEHVQIRGRVQ